MAKKFDLFEALKEAGFKVRENGGQAEELIKEYSRIDEVLWLGRVEFRLIVVVWFNHEHTVCEASYYFDYVTRRNCFKKKVHLNDRRALNAIKNTVHNNNFEF